MTLARRRFGLLMVLLGCVLSLAGCKDFRQAGADSEKLSAQLHAAMSRGQLDSIYGMTDEAYRKNTDAAKSNSYFAAVVRKLGAPVSSTSAGWNLNTTTGGTYLTTRYDTKFANNASGVETIIWKKTDEGYRLYGYTVDSAELVTR